MPGVWVCGSWPGLEPSARADLESAFSGIVVEPGGRVGMEIRCLEFAYMGDSPD